MLRHWLVLAALVASSLFSANGCQSCSSCHDYDPPVANCNYGPNGQQCGCNGGCSSGGCSGCGCNHGTTSAGPYTSDAYSQEEQSVEPTPEAEVAPDASR
jgi:hypothetical protein